MLKHCCSFRCATMTNNSSLKRGDLCKSIEHKTNIFKQKLSPWGKKPQAAISSHFHTPPKKWHIKSWESACYSNTICDKSTCIMTLLSSAYGRGDTLPLIMRLKTSVLSHHWAFGELLKMHGSLGHLGCHVPAAPGSRSPKKRGLSDIVVVLGVLR